MNKLTNLEEELTTIYLDNYSEKEFVKEMATFIRQRELDIIWEIRNVLVSDEYKEKELKDK